ncbi:MAG: hypothetical protein KAH95_15155 [Spirochaetales bacterium]|nr:hypothetical protein [Spirochaetales bacterium]
MTKIERIDSILNGNKPDRAPVSMWYHYGSQFLTGDKYAEIVMAYYKYYDFDWLKVMNDYFYPMPKDMYELKSKEDLKLLKPFDIYDSEWKEQLKALKIINAELNGKAYFCDTVFDPYQELQRSPVGEHLPILMKEEPEAVLKALSIVTDNVIEYAKESIKAGSAGIFLSVLASSDQLSREDFLKFEKPFAMRVFDAVKDLGVMNTAHIHGHSIYTKDILDFPVSIMSWEDRVSGNPSLSEMKEEFKGCVMGGLDNTSMTRKTTAYLINNTREGMTMGGDSRFFLANGCSSPGHMDPFSISAIVDTAKGNL